MHSGALNPDFEVPFDPQLFKPVFLPEFWAVLLDHNHLREVRGDFVGPTPGDSLKPSVHRTRKSAPVTC